MLLIQICRHIDSPVEIDRSINPLELVCELALWARDGRLGRSFIKLGEQGERPLRQGVVRAQQCGVLELRVERVLYQASRGDRALRDRCDGHRPGHLRPPRLPTHGEHHGGLRALLSVEALRAGPEDLDLVRRLTCLGILNRIELLPGELHVWAEMHVAVARVA